MLIVLTAILITLILLICGDKGSKSILSTAMNAGLLLLAVFLIYRGLDPISITVAALSLIHIYSGILFTVTCESSI